MIDGLVDRVASVGGQLRVGAARHTACGAARPAHRIRLHLRRDLPAPQGKGTALVLPRCNTGGMMLHLQEISAVLLLDQAGWHGSRDLAMPENITLLLLPPRSPKLDPVENVWQFMRNNWLSDRVFTSYADILDYSCHAWNTLSTSLGA